MINQSAAAHLPFLKKRKEKRKYVARPGIEPRTPDLRVRCPTDCATRPGRSEGGGGGTRVSELFLFKKNLDLKKNYFFWGGGWGGGGRWGNGGSGGLEEMNFFNKGSKTYLKKYFFFGGGGGGREVRWEG